MYAQKGDNVFINLFVNSTASLMVNNKSITIEQQNNYPWDGNLKFIVDTKSSLPFTMMMRIPGWAKNKVLPSDLYSFQNTVTNPVIIKVNGVALDYTMKDGYAVIGRTWKKNDVVEMSLPMEVKRVVSNEKIKGNLGLVSLQRGPLVYCAEWADNNGHTANLVLPASASFTTAYKNNLLNGVTVINGTATAVITDSKNNSVKTIQQPFMAIPYYSWANRGKGEMTVWFPAGIKDVEIIVQ
jgi:DUF1680 family protein